MSGWGQRRHGIGSQVVYPVLNKVRTDVSSIPTHDRLQLRKKFMKRYVGELPSLDTKLLRHANVKPLPAAIGQRIERVERLQRGAEAAETNVAFHKCQSSFSNARTSATGHERRTQRIPAAPKGILEPKRIDPAFRKKKRAFNLARDCSHQPISSSVFVAEIFTTSGSGEPRQLILYISPCATD
jgi:hypothetical protein